MMTCHVCGAKAADLPMGVYLQRVNPKGEDAIMECYTTKGNGLVAAIEGTGTPLHNKEKES